MKRLKTSVGKKLGKELLNIHPDNWWYNEKDKWFVDRKENHRKSYDRLCELNKEIEGRLLPLDIPHVDLQMLQANLMELYTYFEEASTAVLEQKVIEDSILLRQRQIGRRIKTSIHSHGIPILAILSSEHIAPNSKIYDELSSYQKSRPFDFVVINQDSQLQRRLNTHPAFFQ